MSTGSGSGTTIEEGAEIVSYATVNEANTFMSGRLDSDAWDAATIQNKGKALTMATKAIDRLNFKGERSDDDQVLAFPRDYECTEEPNTEVPVDIIEACILSASAFLDGVLMENEYRTEFMTSQSYASVQSQYDRSLARPNISAGIPSIEAWQRLLPFLRDNSIIDLNRIS